MNQQQGPTKINPKALEAMLTAYFPQVLGEPATARARAQAAYTIASATAGALVAAGALAGIQSFPWPVQVLGIVAVGAWVAAAYLFMQVSRAVTQLHKEAMDASPDRRLTPEEWAEEVLTRARDDAHAIDTRLQRALRATAGALIATVLAFGAALLFPAQSPQTKATLALTEEGEQVVDELCTQTVAQIVGELELDSLNDDYVVVEIPKGKCLTDRSVEIRIPPAHVEGVESGDTWIPLG